MAVQRLLNYLNQTHTFYSTQRHKPAYTALASAKSAQISGKDMAKSVLLKLDGSFTLAVLPSTAKIDLKKIKEITGSHIAVLADEEDLESAFPDCSVGAIPPMGNLYHIPVITDTVITRHADMFFEPGSHREIMKIHMSDFIRLTHPKIAEIHRQF